jgi:hypothetical protein
MKKNALILFFCFGSLIAIGAQTPAPTASPTPQIIEDRDVVKITTNSRGDYVLQIVVTDLEVKGKNAVKTQWLDFEIVK